MHHGVWSRNLKNGETMDRVAPQRHGGGGGVGGLLNLLLWHAVMPDVSFIFVVDHFINIKSVGYKNPLLKFISWWWCKQLHHSSSSYERFFNYESISKCSYSAECHHVQLPYWYVNVVEWMLSVPLKGAFIYVWYSKQFRNVFIYLLTYSMEQSPSWEGNWFAASQEIPHILWNPKVHYHIHKCPPPVPILSQLDPVHVPHISLPEDPF